MLKAFVFKPVSAFKSLPTSNTIFGAICWSIRWLSSEQKLLETLEKFQKEPPFIFSSPMPWKDGKWLFPRPIHPISQRPKSVEEYKKHKTFKAIRWVSWEVFKDILMQEPRERFEGEKESIRVDIIPHASINRVLTVAELYNEPAYWLSSFAVIFRFFDESYYPLVKACLEFSQLGGNRSTGMGRLRLEEVSVPEGMEEFIHQKSSRVFLISECFYDGEFELKESFYDLRVQRPAVENGYGVMTRRVWKDAVCYLTSGSQLKVKSQKDWYGSIKPVLREGELTVYQNGIGFPLFARW